MFEVISSFFQSVLQFFQYILQFLSNIIFSGTNFFGVLGQSVSVPLSISTLVHPLVGTCVSLVLFVSVIKLIVGVFN